MRNALLLSAFQFFFLACGTQQIHDYSAENFPVSDTISGNHLDSMIIPYKLEVDETMNEIIGKATFGLEKYDPESPLGNFAADVVYEAGLAYGRTTKDIGPDAMKNSFCLLNFGGLRAPINIGEVSIGDVFKLMPFDNTLTLVRLKPDQVKELLSYVMSAHGQPISGSRMELSGSENKLFLNDKPYNYEQDLVVVTSDYLANGGDKMEFFKLADRKWDSGILIRDIFIDYIKENKTLGEYPVEDRIKFLK